MKAYLLSISLVLLVELTFGQSVVCIRPDSTVQDTLHVKKFVQVGLRSQPASLWGQITQLKADSVQLKISVISYGGTTRWIALNQITSLQKSSIFSSPIAKYAYNYAFIIGGVQLPRHVFVNYTEWSKAGQIAENCLSGLLVGYAFYFLSNKFIWPKHSRQRTQNGWRFNIVYK